MSLRLDGSRSVAGVGIHFHEESTATGYCGVRIATTSKPQHSNQSNMPKLSCYAALPHNSGVDPACPLVRHGRCFFLTDASSDWNTARAACQAGGGDLVDFRRAHEVEAVVSGLSISTDVWIGLTCDDGCPNANYTWTVSGSVPTYDMWALSQPDSDPCVVLTGAGGWDARSCSGPHRGLCVAQGTGRLLAVGGPV